MKHILTVWHNTPCINCGATEEKMASLRSIVWCYKCFGSEVDLTDGSQEELEKVHAKWAPIRMKQLEDEAK